MGNIKDPKETIKKLCDSFAVLRVSVLNLEKYLGHKVDDCTNDEIVDLNNIFQTIKDGEAKFSDYLDNKSEKKETEKVDLSDMTGSSEGHTPVDKAIKYPKQEEKLY